MKKILVILICVVFIVGIALIDSLVRLCKEETEAQEIELAKQDLIAEYQWEAVVWLDAEKVDNLEGREDFYLITCLVEEDDLYLYRFAAVITDDNGEIDVDTWLIKEGAE